MATETSSSEAAPRLLGRRREQETLEHLLEGAQAGHGGALVVRGEAGVGKSVLLEDLAGWAARCHVARAAGVQSEMELAFAGLHQLCASMVDGVARLPAPQREALSVAFGLSAGPAPDRFLVGLAVLGLMAEAAEEQPLACVVDDAQWLDHESAQVLGFVARRLLAEPVALIFAVREPSEQDEWRGLPELVVEGLDDVDARALLETALCAPLDEQVRDRIVAETRGNPLALLELPRGVTPAELAGGFGLPDVRPLASRLEETFGRRVAALPDAARRLLLVAAAEPLGDTVLAWRAAERLGIGAEAAAAAAADGLVEFGASVRFRHPLVRSAVYRAASAEDRQEAHRALAQVTDPESDPDRRAWHRAQATARPDEDVAAELERSADRAQARGGLAAAAAFLERAVALTPAVARRSRRALAAAEGKLEAGAFDAALRLLATAQTGPLNELQRARVDWLRGQIALATRRGAETTPLLLDAAQRLAPLDVTFARETFLDALCAASYLGDAAPGAGLAEVAAAARAAPRARHPRLADLLLDGLALMFTEGYAGGAPTLKRALEAFGTEADTPEPPLHWLWLGGRVAASLWDDERWDELSARHVDVARRRGALSLLPDALNVRAIMLALAGDAGAADALIAEADGLADVTGSHLAPYGALALAAWRGDEATVSGLVETGMREAVSRGEGLGIIAAQWARMVLYNGLGRYEDALDAGAEAGEHPAVPHIAPLLLAELVEAAARGGRPDLGADALERLTETTQAAGTDWALGTEARAHALLSEGEGTEALYREAIERLGRTRVRAELARAHLVYGEWLRRERRPRDARAQLRLADTLFGAMGAEAFAERAARELLATGETSRKRAVAARVELTAQEAQVARLARDGLSNGDIGSRLFISPRTVEYHLGKVFTKLDISSRRELERGLADAAKTPEPS